MNSKEFKNLFNETAKANGFEHAFGGWFRESDECIAVLDLQKSNFGDYYELNIKIYIQGIFGNNYSKNKNLVKKDTGDIFTRQPDKYKDVLDFDISIDDDIRKQKLEEMFKKFIIPFTNKGLNRQGIKELSAQNEIVLLPAIRQQLGSPL